MNKIFEYSRHLMRAKGRHGTHSPFVYTFVEQVMRARAGKLPVGSQQYPATTYRLLYKTIRHLAPDRIYALSGDQPLLQQITGALHLDATIIPVTGPFDGVAPAMLYLPCQPEYAPLISTFLRNDKTQVLLQAPHAGKHSLEAWRQLLELAEVTISLDYWYFGLLVNDAAFKACQHFRLR